jgi:hypothetical protein
MLNLLLGKSRISCKFLQWHDGCFYSRVLPPLWTFFVRFWWRRSLLKIVPFALT